MIRVWFFSLLLGLWPAPVCFAEAGAEMSHRADMISDVTAYRVGADVARSLAAGHTLVLGTVQGVGKPRFEGDPNAERGTAVRRIVLSLRERLYGNGVSLGSTVSLTHYVAPRVSKTSLGPWAPWEGVRIAVGDKLLVAIQKCEGRSPTGRGKPWDVVFAASDAAVIAGVRRLVALHGHAGRNFDGFDEAIQSLHHHKDPLLAGYLIYSLTEGASPRNLDTASRHLVSLLCKAHVPSVACQEISDWLALTFYRLAPPTRAHAAEILVDAGARDAMSLAETGIIALVRLSDAGLLDLKPHLTSERREKLARNYRLAQKAGRVPGDHPAFESQLGLR